MSKVKLIIGSGAGYAGDRIEPAVKLVQSGKLDYIIFECLAERTIALAQLNKLQDPAAGYDSLLAERMEAVLPYCYQNKVKLITNMGAANPLAAMEKTREIAARLGLKGMKIAVVYGDDVAEKVRQADPIILETGKPLSESLPTFVSANAYLGAESIVPALQAGADVVITGRVADPSLFLAPMIYEFGWDVNDYNLLGKGTIIGHLLECAGQVTGGYYSEPGLKDVPNLANLGFPIAEVSPDGDAVITKLASEGGHVTVHTCKEQMLYELGNPAAYITPDVQADFTGVRLVEAGTDRVRVTGGQGRARTQTLKVTIGYHQGYIGEGEISYAGSGAPNRGKLALEIIKKRLEQIRAAYREIRYDLIGISSLHMETIPGESSVPYEVRLRVAAKTNSKKEAAVIGNEVEALYTNGPAGGGGARKYVREIIAVASTLLNRELVQSNYSVKEVEENAKD